jgi:hypothetical protein
MTAASTIAHSSTVGIVQRPKPDASDEWLADYRQRMQAGINRRRPPEGETEHIERIVMLPEH